MFSKSLQPRSPDILVEKFPGDVKQMVSRARGTPNILGSAIIRKPLLDPSGVNRMVGTLQIISSSKTLGFRTILINLPVENPGGLTTFLIEEKSAVGKCLPRKDLAPRGGFEPPTFRLTAE